MAVTDEMVEAALEARREYQQSFFLNLVKGSEPENGPETLVRESMRAAITAALATPANSRAETIGECIAIADAFTCGLCGMDGEVGDALRALLDKEAEYIAVTDNDEFTRDNVEKTTAANTALYEAWLAERSSPSLPLNNKPQPDIRAEAIGECIALLEKDAANFGEMSKLDLGNTLANARDTILDACDRLRALLQQEGE